MCRGKSRDVCKAPDSSQNCTVTACWRADHDHVAGNSLRRRVDRFVRRWHGVPVNMGALALAWPALSELFVDMSAASILAGFPGDLFVTLVGITYLFAIAQNNGTIDWLVRQAVRSVRGRTVAIPWVMFFVTALLTSVGAVSPGAVAIIAPVALRFSQQYQSIRC